MLASKLMGSAGGAESQLYVDDVFYAYVRTGTGAEQAVTTNIDMTEGYMVWSKGRSGATEHAIYDSARGVTNDLVSNSTAAQTTQAQGFKSVSAAGHTWGTLAKINTSSSTYVDFVFRRAPKFFDAQTATLSSGNATVSFTDLSTLGMVIVKRTDSTGDWYVWHRSLTAGKLMYLNQTAAEATLGHIAVSGITLTLVDGTLADGSYVCYGFAHDTSADGMIQCGSFTTDASGYATIDLGWEPQYVLVKSKSATGGWFILDTMRGYLISDSSFDRALYANESIAEGSVFRGGVFATGFKWGCVEEAALTGGEPFIYLAIRRPNKPPTSGTEVFLPVSRAGTAAAATVTTPFAPDAIWAKDRYAGLDFALIDKLRGVNKICKTNSPGAEVTDASCVTAFSNTGVVLGADTSNYFINASTYTYSNWILKRAPGFMDIVCYTGTGSATTVPHSLGAAPEIVICFRRNVSSAVGYKMWHTPLTGSQARNFTASILPATDTSAWNSTAPTASVFSVGTNVDINNNGDTYVAYLFASLAGISKIGTFTGNGASQTINCGFSAGARMVWIFGYTNVTGRIYMFDSARGIVAANDPYFRSDSSGAEVSTNDSIDPDSSGFIVNQNATTNLNVTGYGYCYLAIA